MNKRELLKESLIDNGCDGQTFIPHTCSGGVPEMNEIIFTRNNLTSLTDKEKEYFWVRCNVAMNCQWFHKMHGHTRDYKEHEMAKHDPEVIADFIEGAKKLLKIIA